jgi:hypothetical protein
VQYTTVSSNLQLQQIDTAHDTTTSCAYQGVSTQYVVGAAKQVVVWQDKDGARLDLIAPMVASGELLPAGHPEGQAGTLW